ncbi:LacI family transcriptional regulator [Leifsonia sp. Root4]|uniref:LacI family DNA-binding transcriptional regulator n=1 Tax=Leifsonia sp. Root4 TaxID=1736525 RepID=UPI000701E785|nr:LacI family DNA-binding transcriptional regulator [Leifsonia sp. Root4]KQW05969.1 LacI family transcriptional regulator [Leifsonia sp. Root4]
MSNPGGPQRRVTIADIAERAGVSIGAVSFALNGRPGVSEATRDRVLGIAEELGWAPASAARSLAGATTETVGLVLARDPRNLGVESFYMRFIAGLEAELVKRSFGLLLQVVPDAAAELRTLKKWRASRAVDGILLVDLTVGDPRVAVSREPGALPTVVVGDHRVANGLTSVSTDDGTAMRQAVRRLAELGHHRITRVAGLETLAHTQDRDAAFIAECVTLGREPTVVRTDYTLESGARVTRQALRSTRPPTALLYDNDVMAVAGLSVALELGIRVPEQLSIIAWDDSVLCEHTFPKLSSLSRDVVGLGSHVARRLFELIDGAAPAAYFDATPTLIERGSTAVAAESLPV